MAQNANILSFDEVRATRSSSRVSSRQLRTVQPAAQHRSSRSTSRRQTSASLSRAKTLHTEEGAAVAEATKSTDTSFAHTLRKRFRAAQASRKFEKTIGARERATAESQNKEQSSRAAMYSMSGSSQKRASRIRQKGDSAKISSVSVTGIIQAVFSSQIGMRALGGVFIFLFVCFMLMPPLGDYYKEVRGLQQLEAEYAALEDYNTQMQAQLDYVSTDEGLEDYARTELGYIRSDEHAVSVEGVNSTQSTAAANSNEVQTAVIEGSVKAPDTWYSSILDPLFGYNG